MSSSEEVTYERRYIVARNYSGWRLDRYIAEKISRMTRSHAHRIIRGGGVRVDPARKIKPGTLLREGDRVVVVQSFGEEQVQFDAVRVLRETESWVAFDKPAGMLVHRTARAFANTLTRYAEQAGYGDVRVVHRLDRETSGVMVMARGVEASQVWTERFAQNAVEKRYLTVVVDPEGVHAVGVEGESQTPLGYVLDTRLPNIVIGEGDWAACTRWRCMERVDDLALLEVVIEGGRQHQIRVHLSMVGTPIVGDKLYLHGEDFYLAWLEGEAETSVLRAPRQVLHAWRLGFEEDGVWVQLEAPEPEVLRALGFSARSSTRAS